jgi:hypothetical protein
MPPLCPRRGRVRVDAHPVYPRSGDPPVQVVHRGYVQQVKHIERTALVCSVGATGLCAAGVRYLSKHKPYDESDPIAITSVFREMMGQVSEGGLGLGSRQSSATRWHKSM